MHNLVNIACGSPIVNDALKKVSSFGEQQGFNTCSDNFTVEALPQYKRSHSSRNVIQKNTVKLTTGNTRLLATWNSRLINKKSASICDLVISKRIDILALTETWISDEINYSTTLTTTIAEITNILKDHQLIHVP